ncbi:hypothetical protein [Parachlamydia sp. AcF125]|uniref:hypothetical protein n=1 Tax=Parachlamydia sp. AcF125 TaxID=2795736 RepID=UPI001BC9CBB4|nr:hypothetical protein [Parachlamydia sp. AcF125]MBS4168371.1 hypothetical protein [Parachlamydia sp. AcF125]
MLTNNTSFLLKADQISDYVPVISTVTNLVALFQKSVVFSLKQKAAISESHYYSYLQQKSFSRCLVLLIPVIGNIMVGIYDFAKSQDSHKEATPTAVQPASPSVPNAPQNCTPPNCSHSKPNAEGVAIDIGRQQSGSSKSIVMGKSKVKTCNANQKDFSEAFVMAGYEFAKSEDNHKGATPMAAQPTPASVPNSSHNYSPPGPNTEGVAIDIGRHQSGNSKSIVMGKIEARTRDAVQEDSTLAFVMAGYEETAQCLLAGAMGKSPK